MGESVQLLENDDVITEDLKIATTFNKYFINITSTLSIPKWDQGLNILSYDPVLNAIEKYKFHPSVIKIKSHFGTVSEKFELSHVLPEVTMKNVMSLNKK